MRDLIEMLSIKHIQRQLHADLASKEALLARGDNETKLHVLDHYFVGSNRPRLDGLARMARMLGFQTTLPKRQSGAGEWRMNVRSETPTYLNDLARQSLLMIALAEAYKADYDGWETEVLK